MSSKNSQPHSLHGYRTYGCRCGVCSRAYALHKASEALKRRRTTVKPVFIDATPLINIYKETTVLNSAMRRNLKRWEKNGITVYEADEKCMKLGYHPIEIFQQSYFEGLLEEEEQYQDLYGELADV